MTDFFDKLIQSKLHKAGFYIRCPNKLTEDHHFIMEFRRVPGVRHVYANEGGIGFWCNDAAELAAVAGRVLEIMHHWRFQVCYGGT